MNKYNLWYGIVIVLGVACRAMENSNYADYHLFDQIVNSAGSSTIANATNTSQGHVPLYPYLDASYGEVPQNSPPAEPASNGLKLDTDPTNAGSESSKFYPKHLLFKSAICIGGIYGIVKLTPPIVSFLKKASLNLKAQIAKIRDAVPLKQ